jgi:septal ring factor EnvC (AmiA/AmiB activator)
MEGLIASLVPTLLVAALTWHTSRVRKDRDQLDANRCERIKSLETRVERQDEELQRHALEIQSVKAVSASAHSTADELKDELRDIRDHMVRKDDLIGAMEGLRQHISDVLRLTPYNRRRK